MESTGCSPRCGPHPQRGHYCVIIAGQVKQDGELLAIELLATGRGRVDVDLWTWTCGRGLVDVDLWTWTCGRGLVDVDLWTWTCGRGPVDVDVFSLFSSV